MEYDHTIKPKWASMESAPKTRPITVYCLSAGFDNEKIIETYYDVYWGIMEAYPDAGKMWIPLGQGNSASLSEDREFIREVFVRNDHGQIKTSYLWRGFRTIAWAEIWKVRTVVVPPSFDVSGIWQNKISYTDKHILMTK